MPAFAVFYSDERGVGVQPVLAMDELHAQDIVRSRHPAAQLKAINSEQLKHQDPKSLLADWLGLRNLNNPGISPGLQG
jgi:hypothetical protein